MRKVFLASIFLLALREARPDYKEYLALQQSSALRGELARGAEATLKEFPKLTSENLAISCIDLTATDKIVRADYHGDAPFYPASVIKLFFMVETFRQNRITPEVDRALHEMISASDNDATAFIVDTLTGTTSGPEVEEKELAEFRERRQTVDRYFVPLGYDISAIMKPWSFGPFGRDHQIITAHPEDRNRATANAVASLLFWIVQRHAVSPAASEAMMKLLERPLAPPRPTENQVKGFLGESLPEGAKLWSKAGDTSEVRHDASCIELPNGKKFIVVVFTRGAAEQETLLPAIGRHLLSGLGASKTGPVP